MPATDRVDENLVSYPLVVIVAVASMCAASVGAQTESTVDVLLHAGHLDSEAVGYAAVRTGTYDAFFNLYFQGPQAEAGAKRLIEQGTPAARVYGYIVLHHVAPETAMAYGEGLRKDSDIVIIRDGCIETRNIVGQLVRYLDEGEYVISLPSPEQALPRPSQVAPAAAECRDQPIQDHD